MLSVSLTHIAVCSQMNALLWERGQSNLTLHHLISDALLPRSDARLLLTTDLGEVSDSRGTLRGPSVFAPRP